MPSTTMRARGYFENLTSPSSFSLKRAATLSTKESYSTNDSAYSSYFNFPNYNQNHSPSIDSSIISYDESNDSALTSQYSMSTRGRTIASEDKSDFTGRSEEEEEETVPSLEYLDENENEEETVPSLGYSTGSHIEEETVTSLSYLCENDNEKESVPFLECEIVNHSDQNKDGEYTDPILEAFSDEESTVDDDISETNTEVAISGYDDQIIETNTTNGSVSLGWDHGRANASSFRAAINNNSSVDDVCEVPEGIFKSDITVTVDIDDEARSSRVGKLDEDNLDVEILQQKNHRKLDSGEFSPRKQNQRERLKFEETVQQGILDDLQSFYTATPKTAKLVLCIVVSVLSDGTLDHTFWSGGRVGLTEIVLQWVLFDADDLHVYKRGRVVRKKDFGFGPLELTENEGQHYLTTSLAPRASNDVISQIGNGTRRDLLSEF